MSFGILSSVATKIDEDTNEDIKKELGVEGACVIISGYIKKL